MSTRENPYVPNVRFRQSPMWIFNDHKNAFPYEHRQEYFLTQNLPMRPLVRGTTISNVRTIVPRGGQWIPTATDPFTKSNTSTPKIPLDQVFLRPFNRPEVFAL